MMAKMVDASTLWKCETCFHHKNGECSPDIWCENGEGYRPDYNKLVFIEAEPVKHGKWIPFLDGNNLMPDWYYKCSECGRVEEQKEPYCNCGARMDGE